MKKFSLVLATIFSSAQFLNAQNVPGLEWGKCLGDVTIEEAGEIHETTDHGFILSMESIFITGYGGTDHYVIKLDSVGNTVFKKLQTYGASSIKQTLDGDYVLVGSSENVTGNHGEEDLCVRNLNSFGSKTWEKSLGGSLDDLGRNIQVTSDSGFIVTGFSESTDGDLDENKGGFDVWLIKLDQNGFIQWQKSFGGSQSDYGESVCATSEGGYVLGCRSNSNDSDVTNNHGNYDIWIVKTDGQGNLIWQKCLGGSLDDRIASVIETKEHDLLVLGYTKSIDGDVYGNHGNYDVWVVKLDLSGSIIWQRCLGGTEYENATAIAPTSDGAYVIASFSNSNDGDVSNHHASTNSDYWILKIDVNGNLVWEQSYGGSGTEWSGGIEQTNDNGYIISGSSSSNDDDVTGNHGDGDVWVVRLSSDYSGYLNSSQSMSFLLFPNPNKGNFQITFSTSLQYPSTLSLSNMLGEKLFQKQIPEGTLAQTFDLSQWQKGIYIVELQGEMELAKKFLVIQ